MIERPDPDAVRFRTLAAPGLDEDEIFAALAGSATPESIWGQAMPSAHPSAPEADDVETARRRRHQEVLGRWAPVAPEA